MKVKELIAVLQSLPQNAVVLGSDDEGNYISPIWHVSVGHYIPREKSQDDENEFEEDFKPFNAVCIFQE